MSRHATLSSLLVLALAVGGCGGGSGEADAGDLAERGSYALGLDIGASIARFGDDIDLDALVDGLRDTLAGREPRLTQQEAQAAMQEFGTLLQEQRQEELAAQMESNEAEGEAFLAENASKEGVTTTASGLQYQVLEEGSGASPDAGDEVTVHYRGTLLDGTEFDSSYERGEPATFDVDGIIPGWTEALQLMQEGGKYRLFIPPALAYGEAGAGDLIGPNATLIFEVELLSVE